MASQPRLLRESGEFIILDKPSGWHTVARQPGKNRPSGQHAQPGAPDVESYLRAHFDWATTLDEAGIVHRLDFETSGCLLVARNHAEQKRLREMFQSEESGVRKKYLALVESGLAGSGEFRLYFTSRHKGSKKVTVGGSGSPRHFGRCGWLAIPPPLRREGARGWVARGIEFDTLEIELLGPGRRHQIRAGLAQLGYPLVGDVLYGGSPFRNPDGRGVGDEEVPRFFLHAWKLVIDGMETIAPVPRNWPD